MKFNRFLFIILFLLTFPLLNILAHQEFKNSFELKKYEIEKVDSLVILRIEMNSEVEGDFGFSVKAPQNMISNTNILFADDVIEPLINSDILNSDRANSSLPKFSDKYHLMFFSGLGFAYSANRSDWSRYFNTCPAIVLGAEVPFTKSHVTSLELYVHTWFAESMGRPEKIGYLFVKDTDTYYQVCLNALFRLSIPNINSRFRISTAFGVSILSTDKSKYSSMDFGVSAHYRLNEQIGFSANYHTLFRFSIDNNTSYAPDLATLNINYYLPLGRK